MSSIDDWLNSLGTPVAQQPQPTPETRTIIERTVDETVEAMLEATPTATPAQELSDSDFDDILSDLGFTEAQEADAEEITEEGSGSVEEVVNTEEALEAVRSVNEDDYPNNNPDVYDENTGESRDLDAEEDADWDALEQAGVITPVTEHNLATAETVHVSVGDQEADVPVVHESSQEPLLPPNSPTLIMDDSTSRFSGTEWYDEIQKQIVIIAGCGGIGSNLAFQVARLHPSAIHLFDDDIVERGNMSGQLFSQHDIGSYKVSAVVNMVKNYTTLSRVYGLNNRYDENSSQGPIMMCGFDNMTARRIFFERWKDCVQSYEFEENKKSCLLLDGRLSVDTLQIFCIRGDDTYNMERYASQYLFDDSEADETICSLKQTTYLACMIGSLMTNLFVNHIANLLDPVIPYDLPFFTEYDAQNMIFKTEN